MTRERVITELAEVMEKEVTEITPETIVSSEQCSAFGWRAFHLGFTSFRVGLAEQPRTVDEICTWYELAGR